MKQKETRELTEDITDTTEEEMPVKTKKFKMKKERNLFENGSLDAAMAAAYKVISSKLNIANNVY